MNRITAMLKNQTERREASGLQAHDAAHGSHGRADGVPGRPAAAGRVRVGEWVEVRSKDEILATLDQRGRLDELPFMPEMFKYCGKQFQVYKRAHKTCDTVSGNYRSRALADGVHLDLRCDGAAHGGCQASCLIFWKDAWLKRIDTAVSVPPQSGAACTEQNVVDATRHPDAGSEPRFVCQATELLSYSKPLRWWDPRHYAEDYTSGNEQLGKMLKVFVYAAYTTLTRANSDRWGKPGRWLYDRIQSLRRGLPFPRYKGTIPAGALTPTHDLDLQPGEWVRVKSYKEILATLNTAGANRNMHFDAELLPYCGRTFKVRSRVERFIDEPTGRLKSMKTPAVILEGVICQCHYSPSRMGCPRSIYAWWRENWLERVQEQQVGCIGRSPSSSGDAASIT
jgi:hypothetical protein